MGPTRRLPLGRGGSEAARSRGCRLRGTGSTHPSRAAQREAPTTGELRRLVAHRLDVVAVGVEDEGAVVVRVVDLTHTRPTVVARARLECGGVERVDGPAAAGGERNLDAALRRAPPRADPEERLLPFAEAPHARRRLHQKLQPERG